MLFPVKRNDYAGFKISMWFLILINIPQTVRSLIHVFYHDSGAQSIASMDINVKGGKNAVALLAQWGTAQLIMSLIIWIVLWGYREFIPLMIAEILVEQILRLAVGYMKPLVTVHRPPGATGTFILLPLSAIMLVLSLIRNEK
ncbi:unnamed protein product [Adineta ricciae]|uniref:Uncharacterized protein n=1 Tax=Adineta ricciae TaxID=249248 RepID=A0A814EC40_ADIRI|nr:unnamed protein product [Adineta ricciae]CAF1336318.1 unnamed protein product [Adineta ricciae]